MIGLVFIGERVPNDIFYFFTLFEWIECYLIEFEFPVNSHVLSPLAHIKAWVNLSSTEALGQQ